MGDDYLSSEELAEMVQAGDKFALARLIERHAKSVFNFLRRKGMRRADAEDVCAETWVRVLNAFKKGKFDRDKANFTTWLRSVARNERKSWIRREARAHGRRSAVDDSGGEQLPEERVDPMSTVEDIAEAKELNSELEVAIDCLGWRDREIVRDRIHHGKKFRQIATEYGLSPSRVHKLYRTALKSIRHRIISTRMERAADTDRVAHAMQLCEELSLASNELRDTSLPTVSVKGLVDAIRRLRRAAKTISVSLPKTCKSLGNYELSNKTPLDLIDLAEQYRSCLLKAAQTRLASAARGLHVKLDLRALLRASDVADELRALVQDLAVLGHREKELADIYVGQSSLDRQALFVEKLYELEEKVDRLWQFRLPLQSEKRLVRAVKAMLLAAESIGLWPQVVEKKGARRRVSRESKENLIAIAATFRERMLDIAQGELQLANAIGRSPISQYDLVAVDDYVAALSALLKDIEPLDHRDVPQQLESSVECLAKLVECFESAPERFESAPERPEKVVAVVRASVSRSIRLLECHASDGVSRNDLQRQVDKNRELLNQYENLAS